MKLLSTPRFILLLAGLATTLFTGCLSLDPASLGLQATSQTDRPVRANRPGSSRYANTHNTVYIEEYAERAGFLDKLRNTGVWVSKADAEALGVDTSTVQEGAADASSGQVVKKGEGEDEQYFLPPQPLKLHMRARRPGSRRFISGSTRFAPSDR